MLRTSVIFVIACFLCCGSVHASLHHVEGGIGAKYWDQSHYYEQYHRYMTKKIATGKTRFAARAKELQRVFTPSAASCDKCKLISAIVADVLADNQLTNLTHAVIAGVCAKITNTSDEMKLCVVLGDVADWVAYEVLKAANGVHWNIPVSMCADVLQLCVVDCCLSQTRAEQFHLSFVDPDPVSNSTTLSVSWTMQQWNPNVTLQYRVVGTNWSAPQPTSMDSVSYRIGGWVGYLYSTFMTGLTADTSYEYRLLSSVDGVPVSDTMTTRTLPLNVGTAERPLRVLALADMGWHAVSNDTVAQMTKLVDEGKVDFVIHYGDIGYADGNEEDWDLFMRKIEPVASRVPYMTTPGNHECLWNFTVYRSRFPGILPPNQLTGAMWYSFRAGGVRFVMLDSESWIDTPQIQDAQIIYADEVILAAQQRGDTAIVAMHRPLYCTSHGADCNLWSAYLRDRIESPYFQHPNVAMVHAGHLHNYERTFPVFNDKLVTTNLTNPSSPVYVVNGAAGNKEGQCGFGSQPDWSAFRTMDIGFMTMEIVAGNSASRIASNFIRSEDGAVVDSFVVTKHF